VKINTDAIYILYIKFKFIMLTFSWFKQVEMTVYTTYSKVILAAVVRLY
jgi:hypothetical protein